MNAQQLKNSILQEAITGRLVPQDPNDEPASKLLERIREEKKRLVKEGKLKKKDLVETPISEDEKPFDIPESWEWVRIKNIFNINPKVTADDNSDAAFIPMEKIEACYGSKFSYEIRKWKTIKSSFTCFADGDIAFAKITPCFQNRKSMILKNLPNGVGAGTTELKVLRPYADTIERGFILYFLASSYFVDEAKFKGTANQQRIVKGYLEEKLFPLPPLAEQKRIVAKIEELMPKVEEYGKAQKALDKLNNDLPERLKKSILQEAIEGRLVPQDPNDEPASALLERIREEKKRLVKEGKLKKKDLVETPISEDEKPFEIPESWEWVRFGEISTYANKKKKINAVKAAPNLWGLDLEDIERGGRLLCIKSVGERKAIGDKTCFSEGDILYSKLRPYLLKVLIAPKDGICTPEIIPFTCYGEICKDYIVSLLKSAYIDDYINSVTFGVKMPRVSTETMVSLIVPLPPLAEQKRIVAKIEELMKEIDKL